MGKWKSQALFKYLRRRPSSTRSHRSIFQDMRANVCGAFNGFGHQTANDFLASIAVHPGTPSGLICISRDAFGDFVEQIPKYFRRLCEKTCLRRTAPQMHSNPFAFNESAHKKALEGVMVFKRVNTTLDFDLFKKYVVQGAFCPSHVLGMFQYTFELDVCLKFGTGQPYEPSAAEVQLLQKGKGKVVPCFRALAPLKAYTPFMARTPRSWCGGSLVRAL
jgi:hypothetical protein